MAQFKYKHPVPSAFTLSGGKDYHLFDGQTYELPADNAHIQALVSQGYLEPVAEPKAPKSEQKTEFKK